MNTPDFGTKLESIKHIGDMIDGEMVCREDCPSVTHKDTPDTWNEDMERNEELMNMNTPDTEDWEGEFKEWAVDYMGSRYPEEALKARKDLTVLITRIRTSRDTYWKERVEEMKYDIEALRGSPRDTDLEYARAITDVHKILDTLLDNLK